MANYFTGTLLASPIVRGSSGDTYGTHHSILGVGGYMEVNSIAERNLLPIDSVNGIGYDGISSGQRRIGMLVYVHADETIYQLKIVESTWSGLTSVGKLVELGNNSNWIVFVAGGDTETSGENITKTFEQLTHGFVVGDVIGYDGSVFLTVSTTTAGVVEPLGMVTNVIDANNFKLTFSGYISTAGMVDVNSSGLTGGTMYYISSTAGKIISTAPTGMTELSKPVLVALSGDTGVVLQYRGLYETLTSGGTVSYTEFTGYTATTQLYLDKTVTGATNLGYFTGYTGIQTLPIDNLIDNAYDGNYISLYNNYYRDDLGYIRIGVASDGLPRRGYLRATLPNMSWVWNEYTGDSASIGWIFVAADVSSDAVYGTQITGSSISFSLPEYTATTWTQGAFYNNGSQVVINTVLGNLTSGTTYVVGGPIYRDKVDKELRLRTIVTTTPDLLSVKYDDYYVKISGTSAAVNQIENVGTGVGVYSGVSGTTLLFKSLVGGGDTTVYDNGDQIIISSTGGGGTGGSGENVTKTITQTAHGFALNEAIGWSSGAYTKAIADGTYDGEILGIVTEVINTDTFNLSQSGYVSGLTGFVTDSTYFVSPTVAGDLQLTAPTTVGQLVKSIFVANSTTSGWVLPYAGYIITPPITGGTGGGTGSTYYTGATPSTCAVGGIPVGTTLTGKTVSALLEEMLVPTINPVLTAPSNTFVKAPTTISHEVGVITNVTFTSSLNKGSIILSGSFQNYRSGDANCYYYNGCGLPTSVASTSLSNVQTVNNYTVSAGTQSWNSCVGYDCGPQPLDSVGNPYGSPLSAGITNQKTTSMIGFFYKFYGATTSTPINSSDVRSLGSCSFQTSNVNTFCLDTGSVCTKFNVALPSPRTIGSVFDLDALCANITSQYSCLCTINVNDGGGTGCARLYNLYEMNVGAAYSANHRHEITTG